jgi:hypothetical protein
MAQPLLLLLLRSCCWRGPCLLPLPTLLLLLVGSDLPLLLSPLLLAALGLQMLLLLLLLKAPWCTCTTSSTPLLRPAGLTQHCCCVAIRPGSSS